MIDQDDITLLYNWQGDLQAFKETLNAKKAAFQLENEGLFKAIEAAEKNVEWMKERIAQCAIAEFNETGKKKLAHGIGIRETKVLDYDLGEALNWAIGAHVAIKLDTSAFDKIAGTGALSFVTIGSKVSATFPMDREKLVQDG